MLDEIRVSPVRELYSGENYHVMVYTDLTTGKSFTATGASLCQHCECVLHGQWSNNKKYGKQFSVSFCQEIRPEKTKQIEKYLAHAHIKHVGKALAKRIVSKYGKKTFEAMESPELLAQVNGISLAKANEITESYMEKEDMQEYFKFLAELGLPSSKTEAVYRKFHASGVDLLKKRPYLLCMCEGISFPTVEQCLQEKPDFAPYNPDRIMFGIMYAMFLNEFDGNVFIKPGQLVEKSMSVLGQTKQQLDYWDMKNAVQWTINQMVREKILVFDLGVLYRKNMYIAESGIAEKLSDMMCQKNTRTMDAAVAAAKKAEKGSGLTLSAKQREGVVNALMNNVYIITGGPGKGKTTLLKVLLAAEKALKKSLSVALCAPTGRAARKMAENAGMPASTIHHLLGLTIGNAPKADDLKQAMEPYDLVVMDESSMCDLVLFYELVASMKTSTRFILIGDQDQLESVQAGNVFGELIASHVIPTTVLDQNFRQGDGSVIITNGDRINTNHVPLEWNEDCCLVKTSSEQDTLSSLLDRVKAAHESGIAYDDIQVLTPFRNHTELGVTKLNGHLQEIFNPRDPAKQQLSFGSRIFREDDRVIHLNKNEDEISNGDMGRIVKIDPISKTVSVEFETGAEKTYEKEDFPQLELAYAMTVHKSQGSEYPFVVMPFIQIFGRMRTRRLLYTAFTRAKSGICIVGNEGAIAYAAGNPGVIRDTYLAYRLVCSVKQKEEAPEQLSLAV